MIPLIAKFKVAERAPSLVASHPGTYASLAAKFDAPTGEPLAWAAFPSA